MATRQLLSLERTHVNKRLLEMRRDGLLINADLVRTDRPKCSLSGYVSHAKQIWMFRPDHPLVRHVRSLGRALARGFPLSISFDASRPPRPIAIRTTLDLAFSGADYQVFRDSPVSRAILLLARLDTLPIGMLRKLLGLSKATILDVQHPVRMGIMRMRWSSRGRAYRHFISLNEQFCAYQALRELAWAVDDASGGEYRCLGDAYRADL
jgi:hypothetical protein